MALMKLSRTECHSERATDCARTWRLSRRDERTLGGYENGQMSLPTGAAKFATVRRRLFNGYSTTF